MNKTSTESRIKFLTGFLLLSIIPSLLIILFWNTAFADRNRQIAISSQAKIRKELSQIRRESDNAFYIQRQLNYAYGFMAEEPVTSANIGKHLQTLKKQGLGFVNFRFFDGRRQLIPVEGESETMKVMVQRIFEALSQLETEGEGRLLVRYQSLFEAFLGSVSPGMLAGERSGLVKVLIKGRPGFFYWNLFFSPAGDGKFLGGMVAWFAEEDVPENLAVKQLVASFNKSLNGKSTAGVIDLSVPEKSYPETLPEATFSGGLLRLKNEITRMRREFVTEKDVAGNGLNILQINADRVLYFLQKGSGNSFEPVSLFIKILLIVLIPSFFFFAASGRNSGETWRQMVEEHVRPVIAVVVGLPVVLFAALGWGYLSMQRQVEQQQIWEQLSRHIENLDENYNVAVGNLEKVYRRLAVDECLSRLDIANIRAKFEFLKSRDALQRLYLIDRDGRILLGLPEGGASAEMVNKLMSTVARKLFQARFGGEQSWKDKVNDVMLESFTSSLSDLLGDAAAGLFKPFENFDHVSEIMFADRRNYVFSTFISPQKGKDSTLMVVWHGAESFAERYLAKQIKRNLNSSELEQPVRLAMVPRRPGKMPYPGEFSKYPFVVQMSERVVGASAQQFSVEHIAGQEWLIAAAPMKKIPGYLVFAMYPAAMSEAGLNRLAAMIIVSVFFCLLLACWLGEQLVQGRLRQTLR